MSAADRARAAGWDVDATDAPNPAGVVMQKEIKRWNSAERRAFEQRERESAGTQRLLDELGRL